jgi:hypothetical protein
MKAKIFSVLVVGIILAFPTLQAAPERNLLSPGKVLFFWDPTPGPSQPPDEDLTWDEFQNITDFNKATDRLANCGLGDLMKQGISPEAIEWNLLTKMPEFQAFTRGQIQKYVNGKSWGSFGDIFYGGGSYFLDSYVHWRDSFGDDEVKQGVSEWLVEQDKKLVSDGWWHLTHCGEMHRANKQPTS